MTSKSRGDLGNQRIIYTIGAGKEGAQAQDSAMTDDLSKTARIPSTRSSRLATDRSTAARRKRFVAEYLIDHNATRAAVAVGYSARSAKQVSSQLLKDVRVKALVAEGEKKILAKAEFSDLNLLEVIRRHVMRDLSTFVREDGQFKALNELTPEQIRIIDKVVREADGTLTYRIEGQFKWVEMAAKHFSLLTERVEMVDHRHIEDKLIEARERAVKLGQAKTKNRGAR